MYVVRGVIIKGMITWLQCHPKGRRENPGGQ